MDSIISSVYDRIKNYYDVSIHPNLKQDVISMLVTQKVKIPKNKLEKQLLIDACVDRFRDAMIKPMETVGVSSALVIGENQVQTSLSSHHNAGKGSVSSGFDQVENIGSLKSNNVVKVITRPMFGNPRFRDEVHDIAYRMIECYVRDYVNKKFPCEIITFNGVNELHAMYPWYKIYQRMEHPSGIYSTLPIPLEYFTTKILRVYFSNRMLYRYNLTLADLCYLIQKDNNSIFTAVYPPVPLNAKIEDYDKLLYIDFHKRGSTNEKDIYSIYATIMELGVSGIKNVTDAYAMSENLLTNIKVNVVSIDNNIPTFRVESSAPGYIPPIAWKALLSRMIPGIEFLESNNTYREFKAPAYTQKEIITMITQCPLVYGDIATVNKATKTVTLDDSIIDKFPYLEYANLSDRTFTNDKDMSDFLLEYMVQYHIYWYIEAICNDVGSLYTVPEIDPRYTFTLNPNDCTKSIGYLATRNMLYQELAIVKVDPIHRKLMINKMTMHKNPVSFDRFGISKDDMGWISSCVFEEVYSYFAKCAFCGEEDNLKSVTARKIIGEQIDIGRGGKNMPPEENPFKTLLNKPDKTKSTTSRKPQATPSMDFIYTSSYINSVDVLNMFNECYSGDLSLTYNNIVEIPGCQNDDIMMDYFMDIIKVKVKADGKMSIYDYFLSNQWKIDYDRQLLQNVDSNKAFRNTVYFGNGNIYREKYISPMGLASIMRILKPHTVYDPDMRWGESLLAFLIYSNYMNYKFTYVGNDLKGYLNSYNNMVSVFNKTNSNCTFNTEVKPDEKFDLSIIYKLSDMKNLNSKHIILCANDVKPTDTLNHRFVSKFTIDGMNSYLYVDKEISNELPSVSDITPVSQQFNTGNMVTTVIRDDLYVGGSYQRLYAFLMYGRENGVFYSNNKDISIISIAYCAMVYNAELILLISENKDSVLTLVARLLGSKVILSSTMKDLREYPNHNEIFGPKSLNSKTKIGKIPGLLEKQQKLYADNEQIVQLLTKSDPKLGSLIVSVNLPVKMPNIPNITIRMNAVHKQPFPSQGDAFHMLWNEKLLQMDMNMYIMNAFSL